MLLTLLDKKERGIEMDYMELAEHFFHNFYRLKNNSHQKKIDESMQGEIFTLLYIKNKNNFIYPGEIGEIMNISSARVATILNGLESKGLIIRELDRSDRRKTVVNLTEEGTRQAEKHNKMVINLIAKILALLGEHDAKELVRIIGKIADTAHNIAIEE